MRHLRTLRLVAPVVVFIYMVVVGTHGISRTFLLLGDQVLYWRIALQGWRDLPIAGGPSSVGGATLGPVFCWTLWAIRHVVGPWTENLPHAGGIGLSIIQAGADAWLFWAFWIRFDSLAFALGLTLIIATEPFDMALSATIWNPPLAVAFVKVAMACALLSTQGGPIVWSASSAAVAILAVQAHSSAVFFAVPLIGSLIARELFARRWHETVRVAAAVAIIVLVLEAPFLINRLTHPQDSASPVAVVNSVSYTLANPRALRPAAAARALTAACEYILVKPWTCNWLATILTASAMVTAFRARMDLTLASVSVGTLLVTVVGFSFWQHAYDHYWFLTIAPSAALTVGLALTAWSTAAPYASVALAVLAVVSQPARIADAYTMNRLPEYGAIVAGSRELLRQAPEVREVTPTFPVPPSTSLTMVYEILGGRIAPEGRLEATIDREGHVAVVPVR